MSTVSARDSRPDPLRVAEVFGQAFERSPAERLSFLDVACAGAPWLRAEIESLLSAEAGAGDFLAGLDPERGGALLVAAAERGPTEPGTTGRRVGPYRVLRELGRGGMGIVYLAERAEGGFEQRVAIKLIKRGMDSEAISKRFLRERQILASFDHPSVARLMDGGVSDDGQPYFAMEYVDGEPLAAYCDHHQLAVDERLRLFEHACRTVQHAHGKLVVHRDLKPSNMLVTRQGELKLLDFGVAKLLAQEADEATALTHAGLRPMTPDYAAPEQVRGEPVTTTTDVYALGVVLYELLTGRRPYGSEARSPEALAQAVCDLEPELPSLAVTRPAAGDSGAQPEAIAQARRLTVERLARRLRGDLDTVVLKALAKKPERRYASAEALAEDVRRHLSGLPVRAQPDTLVYRMGKFARRHALGVAALALVFVSLAAGLALAVWQRGVARQEAAKAAEVQKFLASIFEVSNPDVARGERVTARELLERGAERVPNDLKAQPEIQGELLHLIATLFHKLGLYERAVAGFEKALEVRRALYGADHPKVAETLAGEGTALIDMADYKRAEPLLREALRIQTDRLGREQPKVAETLDSLGVLCAEKGSFDEAERLQREALAVNRRAFGPESIPVADNLSNLGLTLRWKGDLAAAEPIHREALEMHRRLRGNDHPRVAWAFEHLGVGLAQRGGYEEAAPLLREGLALLTRILGEEHPDTVLAMNNLGKTLLLFGDDAEAERLFRRCLDLNIKLHGEEHRFISTNLTNLGETMAARGDYDGAISLHERALALRRKLLGNDHPEIGLSLHYLARSQLLAGRPAQSEPLYAEALKVARSAWKGDHPSLASLLAGYGEVHLALGRPADAEPLLREALQIRQNILVEGHWERAEAKSLLGDCLVQMGRRQEAEPLLREGYAMLAARRGADHPITRRAREALGRLGAAEADSRPLSR